MEQTNVNSKPIVEAIAKIGKSSKEISMTTTLPQCITVTGL